MVNPHFSAAELRVRLTYLRERLKESRLSAISRTGYRYDWQMFQAFCERIEEPSLPATTDTLALWIVDQVETGHKVNTAARRAAAVSRMHREAGLPTPATGAIYELLRSIRRARSEAPARQMKPLSVEELRAISRALRLRGGKMDTRDRAVIVVGFASALRRGNLAALTMTDVEFAADGLLLRIRRSKTDQEARGAWIGLPHGKHPDTCPVQCLRDWIGLRGEQDGALFCRLRSSQKWLAETPLGGNQIWKIVKRAITAAGLDASQYGPHSLRAGFVTAAGEAGESTLNIRRQTGHRRDATVDQYFRKRNAFEANPCRRIDL